MEIAEEVRSKNLGSPERWISIVTGAAAAAYGLTRRSVGGAVTAALGGALLFRGATGHCPMYHALGMTTADEQANQVRNTFVPYGRGIRVEKSVTVSASPAQIYSFWRDFENLPLFMSHLESVRVIDEKHSHWVARAPLGRSIEWDAEIINEIPNELIGWRSVSGSQVDNAGSVHFTRAIGNRGTEVKVILRYDPPGGSLGAVVAKLFGEDPAQQVQEDLEAFKEIVEAA
jgi:uncharacterized membrane protein